VTNRLWQELDVHSLGKETGMGLNWGGLEAIVIDISKIAE